MSRLGIAWTIGFLLVVTVSVSASTYYFSAAGKDTHSATQAQRAATPWKSLTKLNEVISSLQPGDSVLFRRGDIFYGRIQVTVSGQAGQPIVFAAYGSGAEPIIDGSVPLTNWQAGDKTHRWQTTCDDCESVPALYRGERALPLGRYPNQSAVNGGYLTIQQGTASNKFVGGGLPTGVTWKGAEAVVRSSRWTLDRVKISQQSGSTITLAENTTYAIPANFGFFVQNHPATLDQNGEWSYEADRHRITWFTEQAQPEQAVLYAAHHPYVLEIRGQEHLCVHDLTFRRSRLSNVYLWGNKQITLRGIRSVQGAADGLQMFNCQRSTVIRSTFDQNANNGLVIKNSETITVRDNTLTATGTVAGMGQSGDGAYNALTVTGNQIDVLHNTISQIGYVGIDFRGTNITVNNNAVSHFCTVKDDGAGIYTWTRPQQRLENLRVSGNIVLHGGGGETGTDRPEKSLAEGIYLDDRTHNVEVDHNTVAHCGGSGIYVHNSRAISLHHNTLFDNDVPIKMISNGGSANRSEMQIRRCEINNNTLVGIDRHRPLMELISMEKDVARFGTFDANRYVHPFRPYGNIRVTEQLGTSDRYDRHFSLRSWQQWAKQDASSTLSPRYYRPFRVTEVLGENQFANTNFDSTITEWTTWARYGNAQVQWREVGHEHPGSLEVKFAALSGERDAKLLLSGRHGALTVRAGTQYLLRLWAKGSRDDQPVKIILRQSGGDRSELAPAHTLYTRTDWHQYEYILPASASTTTARLDLQLTEDDGTLWIDQVSLQPVVAQFSEPRDSVRFVYNAESDVLDATLSVARVGADRQRYSEVAQVPPYRSLVLLRTDDDVEEELARVKEPTPEEEPQEEPGEEKPTTEEEPPIDKELTEQPEDEVITEEVPEEGRESEVDSELPADEELVTGLDDADPSVASSLTLYPNPAHHQVTVAYTTGYPGEARVLLADAQGRVVYQTVKQHSPGVHTFSLALAKLTQGGYMIRVVTNERAYSRKLIVY